jgi:UDP-N-acetylmuramate: L-alanyl-gamma-D-glutamyl-meso-diaminopimelate ligase
MHIHILGICGTFMGGLAVLAQAAGHTVTGCDANVYPPMSTQLEAQGIKLIAGYGVEQIDLTPDLFVIGNVISRGNALMEAILNRNLPYVSGPQWLGEHVLADKWVLAVAGTHGKTTTSSMLAWILDECGYAPGFLIGGVPLNFGISARLSGDDKDSDFFVIEADEYDTAFFDKRSKFVHYRPRTAILNNLEYDHADIFPNLAAIETQFHHLVRTIPGIGRVIVNGEQDALARVLARGLWSECEKFGQRSALNAATATVAADSTADSTADANPAPAAIEWQWQDLADGGFDIFFQGQLQGRLQWDLSGAHNRSNALAAIAAARHVGVPIAAAIDALTRFKNVKRRMEVRGTVNDIAVIDDFAHHPTAIATTLAGLRQQQPQARILAVLEPRSNTMKLGEMKAALPGSLALADQVFAYGEHLGWSLADALAPLGARAHCFDKLDALVDAICLQAQSGDRILVMSNGGFGGVHERILQRLQTTAPATLPALAKAGPTLIYLHGFRSSPNSFKAKMLAGQMAQLGCAADYHCPHLPASPKLAIGMAEQLIQDALRAGTSLQDITLIGSSLGGYYATFLAEKHGCRAVLLNPAVKPPRDLQQFVGVSTEYHSNARFEFKQEYIAELLALVTTQITRPERYFLIAATGDEVLDWQEMIAHYPASRNRVIKGSDHGLSDFERYRDEVLAFCGVHP